MSRPRFRGFTLVELLVVIGIIGILLGITIPAVMQALEVARKMQCQNRLIHLATAVQMHESSKGHLPGLQQKVGNQRATWTVTLFRYLDQQPIYDHWSDPQVAPGSAQAFYVRFLHCPSAASPSRNRAMNSYVANAGFAPRAAAVNAPFTDPAPFSLAASYPLPAPPSRLPYDYWSARKTANGPFTDHIIPTSWQRHVSQDSVLVSRSDFRDGSTNTMVLSESLQAGDWNQVGPAQVFLPPTGFAWLYAADPDSPPVEPSNAVSPPAVIPPQSPVPPHSVINGQKRNPPNAVGVELLRPSSNHRGGVNVAFADGHVVLLRENINYHVLQALMTPDGRRSDVPHRSYKLKSADY